MLSKEEKEIKKNKEKYTVERNDIVVIQTYKMEDIKAYLKDFVSIDKHCSCSSDNVITLKKYIARNFYGYSWELQFGNKCFIPKNFFNSLKKVDYDYKKILNAFNFKYFVVDDEFYTDEEGFNFIEELKKDHKPLVIKGTEWPYWFKVGERLIYSQTTNYFNNLYNEYNILLDNMLEEYNGPDRYKEHVEKPI